MDIGTYVRVMLNSGYRVKGHITSKTETHYTVKISAAVTPSEALEVGEEIVVGRDMVSRVSLRRLPRE